MAAKFNFHEAYKGPYGAHLNCLTSFSRTRSDADRMLHNRPIHGFGPSRYVAPKKKSKARISRVIATLSKHCERHPNDMRSDGRLRFFENPAA